MYQVIFSFLILLCTASANEIAPFQQNLVDAPTFKEKEKGSLAGSLYSLAENYSYKGDFTIKLPLTFPDGRGKMLFNLNPTYSPSNGYGEMGMGINLVDGFKICRSRVSGEVEYNDDDDLLSPFGRLKKGANGEWFIHSNPNKLRGVKSSDDKRITFFMEDGSELVFGDEATLTTKGGVSCWYLYSAKDLLENRMFIKYIKFVESPLYLYEIYYGNFNRYYNYRLKFFYTESSGAAFVDYRSGVRKIHSHLLQDLKVEMWNRDENKFTSRYKYTFSYNKDEIGLAYFLSKIQKFYPDLNVGSCDPVVTFNFKMADFSKTSLKSLPLWSTVISDYTTSIFNDNTSNFVDYNQDGVLDIEEGKNFDLLTLSLNTNSIDKISLSPRTSDVEDLCRKRLQLSPQGRTLIRLKGETAPLDVIAGTNDGVIRICNREGILLKKITLPSEWSLGPNVKFADLNRDQKPDLIKISNPYSYEVRENISSVTNYEFSEVKTYPINFQIGISSWWISDINGDTIPDLIGNGDSHLYVWYGKGNFEFEYNPKRIPIVGSDGSALYGLSKMKITLIDLNKDGMSDFYLSDDHSLSVYINQGDRFIKKEIELLNHLPSDLFIHPIPINLEGSGNPAISLIYDGKVASMNLVGAETSLLSSMNDGAGNEWQFTYGRVNSYPKLKNRFTIIEKATLRSVGEGSKDIVYAFKNPTIESSLLEFLGFRDISISDGKFNLITENYLYDEESRKGLLVRKVSSDTRINDLYKESNWSYEKLYYNSIPWLRQISTSHLEGSKLQNVKSERSREDQFYQNLCVSKSVTTSKDGVLTKEIVRDGVILLEYPHCLSKEISLLGVHKISDFDFNHKLTIARNSNGQVEKIASGSELKEEISYNSHHQIETLYSPTKGVLKFTYDSSGRLQTILDESGVKKVAFYDSVSDQYSKVVTLRGEKNFEQYYTYNSKELLQKSWDNLSGESVSKPKFAYGYNWGDLETPGGIRVTQNINGSLDRSDLHLITGGGTLLGKIIYKDTLNLLDSYQTKDLSTLQSKKYPILKLGQIIDSVPTELELKNSLKESISEEISSLFGPLSQMNYFEDGIFGKKDFNYMFTSINMKSSVVENGEFKTDHFYNTIASKKEIYTSEDGRNYTYKYDLLGRLRLIILPNNKTHSISYDNQGHKVTSKREDLTTQKISYDNKSGLPLHEEIYDNQNKLSVLKNYEYDKMGRMIYKKLSNPSGDQNQEFTYHYDKQPGFLNSIESDHFQKDVVYRADGKVESLNYQIKNFLLTENFTYLNNGEIKSHQVIITSPEGKVWQTTITKSFDHLGRVEKLTNGADTLQFSYDSLSNLSEVSSNASKLNYIYDLQTNGLKQKVLTQNNSHLNYTWNYNNRGHITEENYTTSKLDLLKSHKYSQRGFLTNSTTNNSLEQFTYDNIGLITTPVTRNSLGQVIKKDDLSYSFNLEGKLSEVSKSGVLKAKFFQDEEGLPLFKEDASGKVIRIYRSWGVFDLNDGILYPIKVNGSIIAMNMNNSIRIVANDLRDSLVDLQSEEAINAVSLSYGERMNFKSLSSESSALLKVIGYAKSGYDEDADAFLMGHRIYDSRLKQFLTADPLFLEDPEKCVDSPVECNLYSYAGNNPINKIDPTGLNEQDLYQAMNTFSGEGWDSVKIQMEGEAKAMYKDAVDFTKGYLAATGVALGVAIVAPVAAPAVGAIGAQVLAKTVEVMARNPEAAITAIGAGVSFAQGVAEGLTNTNTSPDIGPDFGNHFINVLSAGAGQFTGDLIRENYVEK